MLKKYSLKIGSLYTSKYKERTLLRTCPFPKVICSIELCLHRKSWKNPWSCFCKKAKTIFKISPRQFPLEISKIFRTVPESWCDWETDKQASLHRCCASWGPAGLFLDAGFAFSLDGISRKWVLRLRETGWDTTTVPVIYLIFLFGKRERYEMTVWCLDK